MQRKTYRVAALVAFLAVLVVGVTAVARQLLVPSCSFVANQYGAFYRTRSSGGVVVLSDSLMRGLLGDNWRTKTLYAETSGWSSSKGGEIFEPVSYRPLGSFSPPTFLIQRADSTWDFRILSREDKTAFGLSVDMMQATVTVRGPFSTAEREEELLPDGSIRLKRKT